MWFKTFLSFLIAFMVSACATTAKLPNGHSPTLVPAITMHGDKTFTEEQRKVVENAADMWRKQTDGLADLKVVWDYDQNESSDDNVIARLSSSDPLVLLEDCEASELPEQFAGMCPEIALAWVSPSGGLHNVKHRPVNFILIPERYDSPDLFMAVAIHEMGHIFGLPHLYSPQAVMYPTANPVKTCLRQPDLAAFCEQNVCEGHTMHPCEQ